MCNEELKRYWPEVQRHVLEVQGCRIEVRRIGTEEVRG